MKKLFILFNLFVVLIANSQTINNSKKCNPFELHSLSLVNHNPTERAKLAYIWLEQNGAHCSYGQAADIESNLPNWLGTALTGEISVLSSSILYDKLINSKKIKTDNKEIKLQDYNLRPVQSVNNIKQNTLINNSDDDDDDDDDE